MTRPSPRPRPQPGARPSHDEQPSTPTAPLEDASVEDASVEDASVEDAPVEDVPRPTRLARRQHAARSRRSQRWRAAVVLTAAVAVVVLAVVVAVTVIRRNLDQAAPAATANPSARYAPDTAVLADQPRAEAFVAGASSAISAVTAYDYRDLDSALSAGLAVSTGQYRAAYRVALQGELGTAARRDRLVQSFETLSAGIGRMSADGSTAVVLIFGVATVTSGDDAGTSRSTPRTLTATVVARGDRFLISQLAVGANAGLPPGSPQLAVAAEAGRRQVLALLSYRRSDFVADSARALAGAVDPLRATVAAGADDTRARMDAGDYDLAGTVTAVAVERASGTSVELLVAATGYRVSDAGARTVDNDARVSVTVVRAGGQWQVSDVRPVAA